MRNGADPQVGQLQAKAKKLFDEGLSLNSIARQLKIDSRTIGRWRDKLDWNKTVYKGLEYINTQGAKTHKEDLEKGTAEYEYVTATEPRTPDEIIKMLKIDTTVWKLSNYYNKEQADGTWRITALVTKLTIKESVTSEFIDFLSTYKYCAKPIVKVIKNKKDNPNSCLIFNKQDAHLDKFDVDGNNNIDDRFRGVIDKLERILIRSTVVNNVSEMIYILGSDIFDSEWTGMTTKGTPQKSVMPYQQSFKSICSHEIDVINLLLSYVDNLKVIFIPGNHDQFVGWHLVTWLKSYYRLQPNLTIDTNPDDTKYVQFSNTAIMFNHGDGMKPEKLAQVFPIGFKNNWSACDNRYIFTGDKHHTLMKDIGGITFYQIPALGKASSAWDKKHGWDMSKSEMTAFLITEGQGMTDIYKEQM